MQKKKNKEWGKDIGKNSVKEKIKNIGKGSVKEKIYGSLGSGR